jgi:GNAT superfamily N-acetyltransferase
VGTQRLSRANGISVLAGVAAGTILVGSFLVALVAGFAGRLVGAGLLSIVFAVTFTVDQRLPLTTLVDWRRAALAVVAVISPCLVIMLATFALSHALPIPLDRHSSDIAGYGTLFGIVPSCMVASLRAHRRGRPCVREQWLQGLAALPLAGVLVIALTHGPEAMLVGGLALLFVAVVVFMVSFLIPAQALTSWYGPSLILYAGIGPVAATCMLLAPLAPTFLHQSRQDTVGDVMWGLIAGVAVGYPLSLPLERKHRQSLLAAAEANLLRTRMLLHDFWVTPRGLLWGPRPREVPRFYIARHADGHYATYCRADLPPEIRSQVMALPSERALVDHKPVCDILAAHGVCNNISATKTYTFASLPPVTALAAVERLLPSQPGFANVARRVRGLRRRSATLSPIFVIRDDGTIASRCTSALENEVAAEACVETLPEYRGRGYARRVLAAWARDLRRRTLLPISEKVPLFSHPVEDAALAGVARSLGLILRLEDTAYY